MPELLAFPAGPGDVLASIPIVGRDEVEASERSA
jgi:hypothetical protein